MFFLRRYCLIPQRAAQEPLSATNRCMKEINELILARQTGEVVHLYSADICLVEDPSYINRQFQISKPGVPDQDLALKVGAVVILIRNLSFAVKLVNGTKLTVK